MNNEDLISRAALLETMKSAIDDAPLYIQATVDQMITEAPSVPSQVVHGRWSWCTGNKYRCTNCNNETGVDEVMEEPIYNFCPYCGAKMDGDLLTKVKRKN